MTSTKSFRQRMSGIPRKRELRSASPIPTTTPTVRRALPGGGTLLSPFLDQAPSTTPSTFRNHAGAATRRRCAKTKLTVFLCPSATGGDGGFVVERWTSGSSASPHSPQPFSPQLFFAHAHYVTNAGIHQPWGRDPAYSVDFSVPEPIPATGQNATQDGPVLSQLENPRRRRHRWTLEHRLPGRTFVKAQQ